MTAHYPAPPLNPDRLPFAMLCGRSLMRCNYTEDESSVTCKECLAVLAAQAVAEERARWIQSGGV